MQASHASTPSFYLLLSLSDVVQPPPTGREKGERFIAAFIARRVLAAVRIGLWRLLNFDVTKSLSRASIYTIRLARGVHAYLLGIIWEKEKSWQVGIRGHLELVSVLFFLSWFWETIRHRRGWFGVSTLVKSSVNGFVRIDRIAKLYSKILEIWSFYQIRWRNIYFVIVIFLQPKGVIYLSVSSEFFYLLDSFRWFV